MLTKAIAILSFLILFSLQLLYAQTQTPAPKKIAAKRTDAVIKLDGLLDEAAWKDAPAALDYTEFRPTPFRKEDSTNRTEVYMLYNDEGIYLGGYCYERTKDSISAELNGRDGFGNNDFIGFIFDTYEDKINGFEYFITPLGEQMDAKMSPNPNGNSEDFTWNAVWKSAAVIHDDGWSFEIFLPFSAIRFSKKPVQDWGVNITRRRQKTQQQVTWNPIDVNVNGFLTQEGFWTGLKNIKPPLRLQFSPYFSTYVNHYPYKTPGVNNWTSAVNGGMDVKYGISQALTLDMTLVPDFGQVQSDNQVLNLTPFEVKFNENRSFFTEGTELFNKGNLFYSRRVGGTPLHYYDVESQLNPSEHIVKNPSETKLINATKVSGRLQNGLGIGFFNAVTNAQYALVADDANHSRKIQTSPLTNYNIIVLNQSLKNNSSVSFVNTDVWRSGKDYDANVSAVLFDFNDKKNMWNIGGKVANSSLINILPGGKTQSGYSHSFNFSKTSGRFNFNLQQDLTNNKFNSNDLGYFTFNNFLDHTLWMGYRWTKPGSFYNNIYINFNAYYSRRVTPAAYRSANFNANINGQLKNLWYVGAVVGYEPKYNDFNEPRVDGRVFKGWSDYIVDAWVQTSDSKKYNINTEVLFVSRSLFNSKRYMINFNQRYRFNNKLSVSQGLSLEPQTDNVGFAAFDASNNIIFGRRNRNTIENTVSIKYNFNDKMGINARIRHYWSKVDYEEMFTLLENGELQKNTAFTDNVNQNVNYFNIDMTYTWQFAPGSFINIVWKNAAYDFNYLVEKNYFKNFSNTIESDQNNNISFKIIYFLDYFQLKNHKRTLHD